MQVEDLIHILNKAKEKGAIKTGNVKQVKIYLIVAESFTSKVLLTIIILSNGIST